MQPIAASLPGIAAARPGSIGTDEYCRPPIKARQRAVDWRRHVETHYASLIAAAGSQAQREAVESAHATAIAAGPSWAKVRRDATYRQPQPHGLDRNAVARAIWRAEQMARTMWKADRAAARAAGKRIRRTISRTALDVVRALGRLSVKHAVAFPSLECLSVLACCSRRAACSAIRELEQLGLVEIDRRRQKIRATDGRVIEVQATSVYRLLLHPVGIGAMMAAVLGLSECNRRSASAPRNRASDDKGRVAATHRTEPLPSPRVVPLEGQAEAVGRRLRWWQMLR